MVTPLDDCRHSQEMRSPNQYTNAMILASLMF